MQTQVLFLNQTRIALSLKYGAPDSKPTAVIVGVSVNLLHVWIRLEVL